MGNTQRIWITEGSSDCYPEITVPILLFNIHSLVYLFGALSVGVHVRRKRIIYYYLPTLNCPLQTLPYSPSFQPAISCLSFCGRKRGKEMLKHLFISQPSYLDSTCKKDPANGMRYGSFQNSSPKGFTHRPCHLRLIGMSLQ